MLCSACVHRPSELDPFSDPAKASCFCHSWWQCVGSATFVPRYTILGGLQVPAAQPCTVLLAAPQGLDSVGCRASQLLAQRDMDQLYCEWLPVTYNVQSFLAMSTGKNFSDANECMQVVPGLLSEHCWHTLQAYALNCAMYRNSCLQN